MTGFQALLARLLTESALATDLRSDPAAFARAHQVSTVQVRKLLEIDQRQLAVATAVTTNKIRQLRQADFPATFVLIHRFERDHAVLAGVLAEAGIHSARDARDLIPRLEHVRDALAAADALPVLRDMIGFELLWYGLRTDSVVEMRSPSPWPRLAPRTVLADFDHPIAQAHRQIVAGKPAPALPPERTHYLLQPRSGFATRVLRLPALLKQVLAACDGQTAPDVIAARLGLETEAVERVLDQAAAKEILTPRPA